MIQALRICMKGKREINFIKLNQSRLMNEST